VAAHLRHPDQSEATVLLLRRLSTVIPTGAERSEAKRRDLFC